MTNENQPSLVIDRAWSLARREGRALEDGMPESDTPEVLEKYVLVAVLCAVDQVVKILETGISVPLIPEWSIPLVSGWMILRDL